jgi:hypothetical protein
MNRLSKINTKVLIIFLKRLSTKGYYSGLFRFTAMSILKYGQKKSQCPWMRSIIHRKLLIVRRTQKLTLIDMAKNTNILVFFNSSTFGLLYVHGSEASIHRKV